MGLVSSTRRQNQQASQQRQNQGQTYQQQPYPPPQQILPYPPPQTTIPQQNNPHYPAPLVAPNPPRQQQVKTTTIKNQVNLRKKSLRVEEAEGGNRLLVAFEFDAVVPCSVTTFFGATEIPKEGNRLIPGEQPPGERVYYPNKSSFQQPHQFPLQASDDSHQLDLNLLNRETIGDLIGKDTYPIIIRIECLLDSQSNDTHTLSELRPGDPIPKWVQAQTSYTILHCDTRNNNKWDAQVVKQKIWVNGSAYVLQDLYGIEGGVSQSSDVHDSSGKNTTGGQDDDLENGHECVICLTAPKDTAVLPCRHFCMCQDCAKEVYRTSRQCPICRIKVSSLLQIRMQRKSETQGQTLEEAGGSSSFGNNQSENEYNLQQGVGKA
eukprot:TRINITY_DN1841_c0_g1_i11.p1 TRINITY_DN1841_c0_g1~~TRINITY_DN1841_c0_g1_i11.p1  ORF type:complete len:378 (-),score=50.75 TRINITY_DN1841_c0_g1_i11:604-1737(-)